MKYLLAIIMLLTSSATYADTLTSKDINCLRLNAYHEARGEGYEGQVAVTKVVLNRVKSESFPNTVCDVVYQGRHDNKGNPVRNKCQFSWYCDGRTDKPTDENAWMEISLAVQEAVYFYNSDIDFTGGAVFYHATHVKPYWVRAMTRTTVIGDHIFYIKG